MEIKIDDSVRKAVDSFHSNGPIRDFVDSHPEESRVLIDFHDAKYSGWNHVFDRRRSPEKKIKIAIEDAQEVNGLFPKFGRLLKRHLVGSVAAGILALSPSMLSPTHPLASYGYLTHIHFGEKRDISDEVKKDFLVNPEQTLNHTNILVEDADLLVGEKSVVLTLGDNGKLSQEKIRTWNELIPGFVANNFPDFFRFWLDGKHLSRLDDKVDLWLEGKEIVAEGHFHVYGEEPSFGDLVAQKLAPIDQYVIANGIVPRVYFNGELVPYSGEEVVVLDHVMKFMRGQENIFPEKIGNRDLSNEERLEAVRSFLGFLRDNRHVDINSVPEIQDSLEDLLDNFKDQYAFAFNKGFNPRDYSDPNVSNFLDSLVAVDAFTRVYKYTPRYIMRNYPLEYFGLVNEQGAGKFSTIEFNDYADVFGDDSGGVVMVYRGVGSSEMQSSYIKPGNFYLDFNVSSVPKNAKIYGGVLDLTSYQGNGKGLEIISENGERISYNSDNELRGNTMVVLPDSFFEDFNGDSSLRLDMYVKGNNGVVFYSPKHTDSLLVPKLGVVYSLPNEK